MYLDSNIKCWERLRRYDTASFEVKITAATTVPKDWKTFWPSLENKTGLQAFFNNFCCEEKPFGGIMVYLSRVHASGGILLKGNDRLEVETLQWHHGETDELYMFNMH